MTVISLEVKTFWQISLVLLFCTNCPFVVLYVLAPTLAALVQLYRCSRYALACDAERQSNIKNKKDYQCRG